MKIAFYAPMKPPTSSVPSGDRHMARLFIKALEKANHKVDVVSIFSNRDDSTLALPAQRIRRNRLRILSQKLTNRIARRWTKSAQPGPPDLWFTYHLYYKAPDWLGPILCKKFNIPYLIAEASVANKRAKGIWADLHYDVITALNQAHSVIGLNPADKEGVIAYLPQQTHYEMQLPFLDTEPLRQAYAQRSIHRARLAAQLQLDPKRPWLLTVAMMRAGDKAASYLLLAKAMGRLREISTSDWQLILVGDGASRKEIESAFKHYVPEINKYGSTHHIIYTGTLSQHSLYPLYASADLAVWPAINEAYGIALLEAQAAGLPVVAGATGGVGAIIRHGRTGLLTKTGDVEEFAAAIATLLANPEKCAAFSAQALAVTEKEHDLTRASQWLDQRVRASFQK